MLFQSWDVRLRSGSVLTISVLARSLIASSWIQTAQLPSQPIQPAPATWPTLDDLPELRQIDEMAVSSDGRWVAYVLAPVFESADTSGIGRIGILNLKDGRSRVLEVKDRPRSLRWSPNGDLSFMMKTAGRSRVWQYAPHDSAVELLSSVGSDSVGGEILDYTWNPRGDTIAYLAREPGALTDAADPVHSRDRLVLFQDTPGNFTGPTTPLWERDTLGAYLAAAPSGWHAANVIRRKVVSWKGDPTVQWLRTGELGVVGVPLNANLDQLFFQRSVTIIDPQSGVASPVALNGQDAPRNPAWGQLGHRLAYIHLDRPTMDPSRPLIVYSIHAVDRRASIRKPLISQKADGLWDLPPLWSADERTVYLGRYERGSARLFAVDVKTGSWRPLTPDTLSVSHYALANDGKGLLAVLENANQPRELYRLDPASRALTRLTHEGNVFSRYTLGRVEPVEWPSADGRFTIHGFLLKPPRYDPNRRYPLIVIVHGGPGVFYTNSFVEARFDQRYLPAQIFATAGYLVLRPNPRGDPSYGSEFQTALNGDLASGPFHDVDSGVSSLVAGGLVDSSSIAIYGASYGGYLTAYVITQTRRYAAAAIDDGPINLSTLFAQEYALGAMSLRFRLGGNPWTRPLAYAAQSPITFVDRVRTPALMRYGGRSVSALDAIRFSMLAQGFEFYAGLRESNVPVEFVLHPDQGHGIADWQLYRDWVDRTLAWFSRWMPRVSGH